MIKKAKIIFFFFIYCHFLFPQLQVKNYFSFTGKKDIAVNTITQDKMGFLWLGTSEGVFKFDGKTSVQIGKDNPVLKKIITAVFIDSKEIAWIGTNEGKVYSFYNNKLDSITFPKPITEKITSICEINSIICIGSYGSGIFVLNNKQVSNINSEKGLGDNVVYKVTTDKKNTVWCATDGGITEITDLATTPKFKLISNKIGLPDNIVRDVSYEGNRLVISMQDSGVCSYNLNSKKIERVPFFSNWSLGTVINANANVPNKTIIATEKNGFLQINKGTISIYNYEKYLQTTNINQLFIDKSKQIWVASKKGISQFYERRFDFINSTKGLTDDKIPIGTKQQDRTETIAYTTHTINLNKGDSFYIFTDGYADQFGGAKEKKYSTGKLKELILKNSKFDFKTQGNNIKDEHIAWKNIHEQVDDILIIGFKI